MTTHERITHDLDDLVAEGYVPGYGFALIESTGSEEGFGGVVDLETRTPVTARTAFRIASLSKLVGAIVTLQQVEQGVFALDDPISRWVPELAHPLLPDGTRARTPITIRHLLTMTSGWGVLYTDGDEQAAALTEAGLAPGPSGPRLPPEEYLARLAEIPLAGEPGTRWRYHTSFEVLSILLPRATGRSNDELVAAGVVAPLDLSVLSFTYAGEIARSYDWTDAGWEPGPVVDPGFECFGSGLIARPLDIARVFADVAAAAPVTLSVESARSVRTAQISQAQRESAGGMLEPWTSWGYGAGVNVTDTVARGRVGRFGWSGGTGCVAGADPVAGIAAAYLGTRAMGSPTGQREFGAFWDAVYTGA